MGSNVKERMKSGKLYFCTDEELAREQLKCLDRLYDFNQTRPSEMEKRSALLKEILAEVGENCYVEPPLHANWGIHTHFGRNVYANFNLTRNSGGRWPSSMFRSGSAATSGSGPARFCCPA